MKKKNPNKQRAVKSIYLELKNNRYRVGLVINKEGKKDPMLITNVLDEAVNKYLDKCKQYSKTPDVKLIYSFTNKNEVSK